MHDVVWIHWFMVGFFVLFGATMLLKRESFGMAGGSFCSLGLEEPARVRVRSAVRLRQEREGFSSVTMAESIGGTSLGLAAIAALTSVSVTLLYAALTLVLASVLTTAYVRFRRAESRRVASLVARHVRDVAPWYVWAVVTVATVLPLCWLDRAPSASLAVTVAGIAIGSLANRVATMPALLTGDDVPVERYVDERLRAIRTANLLAIAVAPAYIFEAFSGYTDATLHLCAFLFGALSLASTWWFQFAVLRRRPSRLQIAEWSHGTF
ncbi:MAG: hypothetical protein IAI50_14115 [Candidatus Eremiobacteraeota bacterium]|nr:hypothetical protein [Candidatus Eremiobacteraeota bacterium]